MEFKLLHSPLYFQCQFKKWFKITFSILWKKRTCDTGLAGMFKFLWLVSLTCKFCIQNTETVKGNSIRGFNCSNCVTNKRWNVRLWRGASVASVHLQFMLLSTSPRHCVYFEKPVVFALDSWRETSWWIAGGVKVSPTRGKHRNESMLFSYWALPSAAWHPSARCYHRLLGQRRVVHIKGPFHQILHGKTQIEAMFPLHVWQMLIELLKISGRGFLMNWISDLTLVTKQKMAAWAGQQVPHFVNCFQHELKWCSSHGWDMSRSACFPHCFTCTCSFHQRYFQVGMTKNTETNNLWYQKKLKIN